MKIDTTQRRRRGFTLVEMLVVIALTVFIMTILSQAFVAGLETFRQLKAIGDMHEGLRTAATRLQADLLADHFEDTRRLSDQAWVTQGVPREGYLRIEQGSLSFVEGVDGDGLPSFRAIDHRLFFTIRARGNRKESFLAANVPANSPLLGVATTLGNQAADARYQDTPGTYTSAWAEVGYFLQQTGTTIEQNNPTSNQGTPLFTLFRSQRVMVSDSTAANALNLPGNQVGSFAEMSCQVNGNTGNVSFNSPVDLAAGQRSITSNPSQGASPLLSNVISFQVQIMPTGGTGFIDVPNQGAPPAVYDTGLPTTFGIGAVQISIRVWDPATQQSRQMTFIQDM